MKTTYITFRNRGMNMRGLFGTIDVFVTLVHMKKLKGSRKHEGCKEP
ncbi:MAG: hypothetical protein WBM77_13845 [Maribacter sp.]